MHAAVRSLLDRAALSGAVFSHAEACLDVATDTAFQVARSERERAARWRWTRHQVRLLVEGLSTASQPTVVEAQPQNPLYGGDGATSQPPLVEAQPHPLPLSTPIPNPAYKRARTRKAETSAKRPAEVEPQKRFSPPSLTDVQGFAAEKGLDAAEAAPFFFHFESNGWRVSGRSKMVSWKASFQSWCLRSAKPRAQPAPAAAPVPLVLLESHVDTKTMLAACAQYGLRDSDFMKQGKDWKNVDQWKLPTSTLARLK